VKIVGSAVPLGNGAKNRPGLKKKVIKNPQRFETKKRFGLFVLNSAVTANYQSAD